MGCDIHIFLEEKVNDKWECSERIPFWRNYDAFAYLGYNGRRANIEPKFELRGLPKDISEFVKGEMYDDHSHSWLTPQEVMELGRDVLTASCRKKGLKDWYSSKDDEPFQIWVDLALKSPNPTRFVFFFDN